MYLFTNADRSINLPFGDKSPVKRESALIPASGAAADNPLLTSRCEMQHYAMSCCVTLLYVCNVIFSSQRDSSHGVKLVNE